MSSAPTASIVIPTRRRPGYLDVTLGSVVPQARDAGAEVLVISDGTDPATEAVAGRHGARFISLPAPRGLNAARNAAVAAAQGDPIVLIDDDIVAPQGWLASLLDGVRAAPDHDVFGGPIHARLEGGGPRGCGREPAPISTQDFGAEDRDVPLVWGANMAIRRRAFDRIGTFDGALSGIGDEEEWELRYTGSGGRIRYLADAGVDHRRTAADSRLRALMRAGYARGREARRNDARKGHPPALPAELRTLAGCVYHVVRRRCAVGLVLGAHAVGRLREAMAQASRRAEPGARAATVDPLADDFVSGTSGHIAGIRRRSAALLADAFADGVAHATLQPERLRRAALRWPARSVLALGIEHDGPNLLATARAELERSRHTVRFASTTVGGRGKFENLDALLSENPAEGHDWLLVVDDDVILPTGFLDAFVFLAETFSLRLAQPAQRAGSHAAWQVTRRRAGSVARETGLVEIGPVVGLHRTTFELLLPFPELRTGWGLDLHWSALAHARGWRIGVLDAIPVLHNLRPIARSYDRDTAIEEARRFLADRPYTKAVEAQRTIATHRSW